jgi:aspartate/tyrosine/aromatic aminotransferase
MSLRFLDSRLPVEELHGKTFNKVYLNQPEYGNEEIVFEEKGTNIVYKLYHQQDCCEQVYVEDIVGDLKDLENAPILSSKETTSNENPPENKSNWSFTWNFYDFSTTKGFVTIRFYGESNGYYSEKATLQKFEKI